MDVKSVKPIFKYQDGQHVCSNCGLVQQKKLSHEAEYRFYGDSDNKSNNPERVGLPSYYMLPESSLGTMITHRSFDKQSIKRMVQYNTWSQMPYKERSLIKLVVISLKSVMLMDYPADYITEVKNYITRSKM